MIPERPRPWPKHFIPDLRTGWYSGLLSRLLLMMVLYTICRVIFYQYNRDLFHGMHLARFLDILQGGVRFDFSGLIYLNLPLILLVILPVRLRFELWYQRLVHYLFVILNVSGLLVNLADVVYYRTTLRRTTLSVLDQFENETNLAGLSLRFITEFWSITLLFIVLSYFLVRVSGHIKHAESVPKNNLKFYGGATVYALLTIGVCIGGMRGDFRKSTRPITMSNAFAYAAVPEDVFLIVNTPFSLIRTATTGVIKKVNYYKSEEALEEAYTPVHRPMPDSVFKRMNVVVIILESFSMEFSGFYNRQRFSNSYEGYMPFLDSLAGQSYTFKYSFANGRKSIDAMPSVLSSIPSVEVPFVLSHFSSNRVNSIASLLKSKGYYSAFFHGAPNGSMGFDAFSKQTGFDAYFGKNEFEGKPALDGIWGIWDHEFFPFFAAKLNQLPEPICAAMFSLSSHHPFKLPVPHAGRYRDCENKMYKMVQYTDEALKHFFEEVSDEPWFDKTLFVITADHVSSEVTMPEYKTPWGQYAVPIIFYQRGMKAFYDQNRTAQQIDILPSILSYLNYDRPFIAFGKDLFKPGPEYSFNYAGMAYQLMDGNYLFRFDGKEVLGLFDYRNNPLMTTNVSTSIDVSLMRKKSEAMIQQYNNRMVENRLTIDQE
ncbi:MAG: LTA synthase family protein [Cyclobacteriaceae bacterium]